MLFIEDSVRLAVNWNTSSSAVGVAMVHTDNRVYYINIIGKEPQWCKNVKFDELHVVQWAT